MTVLLDANALIALVVAEHEHHERVAEWFTGVQAFAVCPILEGVLVRFLLRVGESASTASSALTLIRTHPRCEFWADDASYADLDLSGLGGHRQVTDAYLAGLASTHGGNLATLDEALANSHPAARLIPEVGTPAGR